MIHCKNYCDYQDYDCQSQAVLRRMQWKPAMVSILWGFTLMMLQFQYLLNYAFLIPAAGILLTFLGFYRLRGENHAMHTCYRLSLLALFLFPFYLLSIATPLILFNWLIIGFQVLLLLYQLLLLFFFRSGLKHILRDMNSKTIGDPILVLMLWVILQQIMAYTSFASSMFVWILFVIVFLLILWVIWIHSSTIFHAGYIVRTKIGVLCHGWCMGAYAFLIMLFLLTGTVFTLHLLF